MSTKREIIVEMLRWFRDAQETLTQQNGTGDGGVTLMPRTWNRSFRELERCLQVLSGERPKQARMILARYVDPTVSRRKLVGRRNNRGEVVFVKLPPHSEVVSYAQLPERGHAHEWDVVLRSWPVWVRNEPLQHGLDRLEHLFRGDPFLPAEFLELAA